MPSGADAGTPRIDCHDVRPYRMRGSELSSASSPTSRCAPEDHEAELKARRAADNRGRPGAHRLRRQNLLSNALKFTRPEVNRWSSAARSASSLAAASRSRACPEWGPHSRWHGESVSLKGASGRENASSDHHPPRRRRPEDRVPTKEVLRERVSPTTSASSTTCDLGMRGSSASRARRDARLVAAPAVRRPAGPARAG